MALHESRRALLQASGATALTALSGCLGFFSDDASGEPDAGTGSYGILLLNDLERTYTVTITVRRVLEEDPIFSETAEIEPGGRKEWERVMTEDSVQYRVEAELEGTDFYTNELQHIGHVSVDTPVSPEVENVVVTVAPYFDTRTVWVNTTASGQT